MELPDHTMPLARELFLFRGKTLSDPQDVSLSKVTRLLTDCAHYFEPVALLPGVGIEFVARDAAQLLLGCGPQDVISLLGPPDMQHAKRENKLRIHSEGTLPPAATQDYFYNYFTLGLDILFDGCDDSVLKFVVHSNFPTHEAFNQYAKCNWSIRGAGGEVVTADARWSHVHLALGITGMLGGAFVRPPPLLIFSRH